MVKAAVSNLSPPKKKTDTTEICLEMSSHCLCESPCIWGHSKIKKKNNDGGPCMLANQNLVAYVWVGLLVCLNWEIVGQIFSGSEQIA